MPSSESSSGFLLTGAPFGPKYQPISGPAETAGLIFQTFIFLTSKLIGMVFFLTPFSPQLFQPTFLGEMVGDSNNIPKVTANSHCKKQASCFVKEKRIAYALFHLLLSWFIALTYSVIG